VGNDDCAPCKKKEVIINASENIIPGYCRFIEVNSFFWGLDFSDFLHRHTT